MLKLINPDFSESWVKEYHVFRTPHAQPVFTVNFVDLMPAHRTPIRGLYVRDSTHFYPEDHTISQAIRQGRAVAATIIADFDARPWRPFHEPRRGGLVTLMAGICIMGGGARDQAASLTREQR